VKSRSYAIGIDMGGTRIKGGAVTGKGKLLGEHTVPTPTHGGRKALLATVESLVRQLQRRWGVPSGVGLALSGVVEPDFGVVYLPGKVQGLEGLPLVPSLRRSLRLPVRADNDGRLAMLAERRFGAARGEDWAVTLTLGTGIGSGVVVNGEMPVDEGLQFGTQAGHLVLQSDGGKACLTTCIGTAETLCSCTALAMAVREALQRGIPSRLTETYGRNPHSVDFRRIVDAVRSRDQLSVQEFTRWTGYLARLVTTVIHAYGARRVIFAGGGAHAADLFLPSVRRWVAQHTFRYPPHRALKILISPFPDHSGVFGAAALHLPDFDSPRP